jgi:histidinol phosphatase-like enzyme
MHLLNKHPENINSVGFLPNVQNNNLITRKHQTSSNQRAFNKKTCQYSKSVKVMKKQTEELLVSGDEGDM